MNSQANTFSEPLESRAISPAATAAVRPFYWSIRRELWENRYVYLAPVGAAALFFLGFLITLVHLPGKVRGMEMFSPMQYREAIAGPYDIMSGAMMLVGMLVSIFYCLDALYGERRDRSILFWKSLPISDRTTVLAKATIPFVIVPLLTFVTGIATHFLMLVASSLVLLANGLNASELWTSISYFRMSWLLLYHLLTAHTLWPAPWYAWLLFVSARVRRAPFLWAVLPPVALAALEKITFHTSHLGNLFAERFIGSVASDSHPHEVFPTNPMFHIHAGEYFGSPGFWIGIAIAAAFLVAAVRLRRYQAPI